MNCSPYILQWADPSSLLKIARSMHGGFGPLSINTWFLEPTGAHNPDGISIGSAVFAGLTTVTDRTTGQTTLFGR